MILMIDNYDSFTYNLVQYLGELGANIKVFRNDKITVNKIKKLRPARIVISPGPGRPIDAGVTLSSIKKFAGKIPILGVCLGHQAIAHAFGAKIISAKKIMHGKTSAIFHDNKGVFNNIPNPFQATRYHSLVIDQKTLSSDFEITAWTEEEEIMGIQHRVFPLEGVQFHPEAILTEHGLLLLKQFVVC